jgi:hypothetical protein
MLWESLSFTEFSTSSPRILYLLEFQLRDRQLHKCLNGFCSAFGNCECLSNLDAGGISLVEFLLANFTVF